MNSLNQYFLYFDGASKGNPGHAGAGAVIYENDPSLPTNEVWGKAEYVGKKETNNVAEYSGLIMGLKEAVSRGVQNLIIRGDSQLVIKQMRGEYKVNATNMQKLNKEARDLSVQIPRTDFQHVYREHNKRADELSNIGIDMGRTRK